LTLTITENGPHPFVLKHQAVAATRVWYEHCLSDLKDTCDLLRITVVENQRVRRVIVEGRLTAPWASELAGACQTAEAGLQNRKLIVDLRNVNAISPEGEDVLLDLIRRKIKFVCGVYTKEIVRQLVRRTRSGMRDSTDEH
jgi:anti-anti-sigma regulatory factor